MSTRATVHFKDEGSKKATAIVYRHSDGYPDGLGKDLQMFLERLKKLDDNRFNDAAYLAAKFVVWQTLEYDDGEGNPLDVIGIGIVDRDPGDIEYRYTVQCNGLWPVVSYTEVK